MKYLLDTCVLSDFVNGDVGTLQRIKETNPALICLSTITVSEVYYGFTQYTDKAAHLKAVLESFLRGVTILPFEWNDAHAAAAIKASLGKIAKSIGTYDTLIAGTAQKRGLILVTNNTTTFTGILGLQLENWR